MNQLNEVLNKLNQAIAPNHNEAKNIAHRGEIYRQMKCYEKALADFNRAIELKSDYAWAIAHRGVTYRRLMHYEEALADLNRAVDLKPDYAWAHAYRGVIYSIMTRYEEAVTEFTRAIAIDETLINHWGNERGFPLTCLGLHARAIECYQQTLKVRPYDPLALYFIAVTQFYWQGLALAQTQIDKARAAFLSALNAKAPINSLYENDTALYGLGGLAALEGNFEQALNYLQKSISLEYDLNVEMARHDPAWLALRSDPYFKAAIATPSIDNAN